MGEESISLPPPILYLTFQENHVEQFLVTKDTTDSSSLQSTYFHPIWHLASSLYSWSSCVAHYMSSFRGSANIKRQWGGVVSNLFLSHKTPPCNIKANVIFFHWPFISGTWKYHKCFKNGAKCMKNSTDIRIISELWPFIHRIIFVYTENISPCDIVLICYNSRLKESI